MQCRQKQIPAVFRTAWIQHAVPGFTGNADTPHTISEVLHTAPKSEGHGRPEKRPCTLSSVTCHRSCENTAQLRTYPDRVIAKLVDFFVVCKPVIGFRVVQRSVMARRCARTSQLQLQQRTDVGP